MRFKFTGIKESSEDMEPIEISAAAAIEIKKIMSTKNIPDDYELRVTLKASHGCLGAQLNLGFDRAHDDDLKTNVQGIPVLISKKELMFIIGKRIEFYDGSDARGFHFEDIELKN